MTAGWEHFAHGADIGVRGTGADMPQAFEQAALALTGIVTDVAGVRPQRMIAVRCRAPDPEMLLADWLNRLIYEMAARNMLFGKFEVGVTGMELEARAWGETVDVDRHRPAVEPKGATYTELAVRQQTDGTWIAQCVVDV